MPAQRTLGHRSTERGQSLVEFALVFPVFVVMLMGILEFGLAFNAVLDMNFASRDAALIAAEAGSTTGADCLILRTIERSVGAPANPAQIQGVEIYWADATGGLIAKASNSYSRTGSTTCTLVDNSTVTVPYTATSIGYPDSTRCDQLAGCDADHPGLDNIGVQITYVHPWRTPLASFIGSFGAGFTFVRANTMRMEPVL